MLKGLIPSSQTQPVVKAIEYNLGSNSGHNQPRNANERSRGVYALKLPTDGEGQEHDAEVAE